MAIRTSLTATFSSFRFTLVFVNVNDTADLGLHSQSLDGAETYLPSKSLA